MLKEIRYLIFLLIIFLSLFFIGKFYFSDTNKKNSHRSLNNIDEKKNIDFFLKITGGSFNYVSMINKIQEIRMVQSCYLVNLKSPKSKYNLIFE